MRTRVSQKLFRGMAQDETQLSAMQEIRPLVQNRTDYPCIVRLEGGNTKLDKLKA